MKIKKLTILTFCLLMSGFVWGQLNSVEGILVDSESNLPLAGLSVYVDGNISTVTDAEGRFYLGHLPAEAKELIVELDLEVLKRIPLKGKNSLNLGTIRIETSKSGENAGNQDLIPTITLSDSELQDDDAISQNVSGLLTASRDAFSSAVSFTFGPRRFRFRGYDSENTTVYLNGAPMNDIEIGRPFWSSWSGLNDVLRNRSNSLGLGSAAYSFGGIGGASSIDARASRQWQQLRVSYAVSNRSYRQRLMATYSTGRLKGGWAFSFSGSKRWADEGYVPGSSYDAYSYFASVEKELSEKHSLNFTALGAPNRRGRYTASTDEWYDLAGTNYYNPYWGYQDGEKRNARISTIHQPLFILTHNWKISGRSSLMTAVSYQDGRNGSTALDWYEASDPRPDYYRKSPSYMRLLGSAEQADEAEFFLRANEKFRQINWDGMFEVNRNSFDVIEDANGIQGNSVSGKRSRYIVEERRYDSKKFNFNTLYENVLSDIFTLNGGISYQYYNAENYKLIDDLLGGDFYLDIDKFAERDSAGNIDFIQSNVDIPNRVVVEGDRFGYDYESNIHKASGWLQGNFSFDKVDFYAAADVSNTRFWRTGNIRNGKFPDNSLGDSEKQSFTNFGLKAGVTYKIDGRNYLFANGAFLTRAPFFRNAYVSARTRDQVVPGLENEKIYSVEGGYFLRSPYAKARVVGYFTQFKDQFFSRSFFLDNAEFEDTRGGYVNYIMKGLEKKHIGIELAGEFSLGAGFSINAVAAIGEYTFSDRPEDILIFLDNAPGQAVDFPTVYLKNFYVPGTPQSAYTLGLRYSSARFWFANINFNYLHRVYMDFFPDRRTIPAVTYTDNLEFQEQAVLPGSPLWESILYQDKGDGAFSVDLFGGKSWKFGDVFLYLNVGINNILNDRDFKTGGFEQFRFDFTDKEVGIFPNKYYYGIGRNYFVSLTLRM